MQTEIQATLTRIKTHPVRHARMRRMHVGTASCMRAGWDPAAPGLLLCCSLL